MNYQNLLAFFISIIFHLRNLSYVLKTYNDKEFPPVFSKKNREPVVISRKSNYLYENSSWSRSTLTVFVLSLCRAVACERREPRSFLGLFEID